MVGNKKADFLEGWRQSGSEGIGVIECHVYSVKIPQDNLNYCVSQTLIKNLKYHHNKME